MVMFSNDKLLNATFTSSKEYGRAYQYSGSDNNGNDARVFAVLGSEGGNSSSGILWRGTLTVN